MLSRLRLSSKMVLAAAPLVAVLVGLLTLTVGANVDEIGEADRTGKLGATWIPLVETIEAVDAEQDVILLNDPAETQRARAATDAAITSLDEAVGRTPDSGGLDVTVTDAAASLGRARAAVDSMGDTATVGTVFTEYGTTQETLVNLGDLLAAEATDPELGRKLQAVAALTRAAYNTDQLLEMIDLTITSGRAINVDRTELLSRNALFALERFEATAPADWIEIYERRNLPATTDASFAELDWLLEQGPEISADDAARFDMQRFSAPIVSETGLRNLLAERVTTDAAELSSGIAQQTFIRIGYVTAAILVALVLSFLTSRSITRRMSRVSERARQVATEQLPVLVESLRDPNGSMQLPEVTPIDGVGTDEIGELAESFTAVQSTLVDVATEQMDVLRRGVSDIFVTLARRNRSLVDRQLALLDELEAEVEDPELLSNYYKLDHMATRMRRSAESLLVLANSDTQRRRSGPIEIDDVVRAAISEVEDYRRVDVLALESLQIKGPLVADTSHLLAELLDNAASFSPPDSRVSVAGHFTGAGYLITISDRGVGIPGPRLHQLNALLTKPPVIGLSVEPTLGLSVVSLLAAKHGIKVSLVQAAPGISVNVVIPSSMYQHTTDPLDPSYDDAFEAVFDEVVNARPTAEVVETTATVPTTEDEAVRATSTALDAIASLNRDPGETPASDGAGEAGPSAPPVTGSGLPQRRPTPTRPDVAPQFDRPADAAPTPERRAPEQAPSASTPTDVRPAPAPTTDLPQRTPAPAPAPTADTRAPAPTDIQAPAPTTDVGSPAAAPTTDLPQRTPAPAPAPTADTRAPAAAPTDIQSPAPTIDVGTPAAAPTTDLPRRAPAAAPTADTARPDDDAPAVAPPPSPSPAAPGPTTDLPAQRPAVVGSDPVPHVPDFRPVPTMDAPIVAPVDRTPVMPAPAPRDLSPPDLAPPPAPTSTPAASAPAPMSPPAAAPSLTSSGLPLRRPGAADPTTDAGLPRRDAGAGSPVAAESRAVAASTHDPEALRSTLSAFHTSTQLGRLDGSDLPDAPPTDTPTDPTIPGGRD